MQRPDLVFEMDYARTHRAHAHRCQACNRRLREGEPTLWVRLRRRTRVCHAHEADEVGEPTSGATWRELFLMWARAERNLDARLESVREALAQGLGR